jgi:hypothetical protein
VGEGFNSSISPLQMEKYLLVADEILDQAIKPDQLQITWKAGELDAVIGGKPEAGKADGTTRTLTGPGELITWLAAPVDGTYTIRVRASTDKVLGKEPTRIAVRIDNQVVGEAKVTANPKTPGTYTVTCRLPAGRAKLSFLMANPFVQVEAPDSKRAPQPAPPKPGAKAEPGKPEAKPEAKPEPAEQELRTAIVETVEVTGPPAGKPSELQRRLFVATRRSGSPWDSPVAPTAGRRRRRRSRPCSRSSTSPTARTRCSPRR